ncbi:MAG TPA: hypothetical protein VIJ92_02520 [Ginsengibacter sp.]
MFSKQSDKLPVDDFDKDLIEKSLLWFENKLGPDYIRARKTLIPTNCDFQYNNANSDEAINYFIQYICNHLELNSSNVTYIIVENNKIVFSEGFATREDSAVNKETFMFRRLEDGNFLVTIYADSLKDFDMFFIQLAYNLTFLKFYSEGIFNFANGYMINFAMVLMGFGLLCSNISVRSNQWQGISHYGWQVVRFGFISQRMYGYILALLAEYKDEDQWENYLCVDVLVHYKNAASFICKQSTEIDFLNEHELIEVNDEEVFMSKSFYENGKLRTISHYKNKKYEGLMVFYHQNGKLWSERIYKNGISYNVLSNYNSDGVPVEKGTLKDGNGSLYIYNPNGTLLRIENYQNEKRIDEA